MARLTLALAALALFASAACAQELVKADCKLFYPPYTAHEDDVQQVTDPSGEGGYDIKMFSSRFANGADALDFGKLILHPGKGWAPHRHLEADEWLYVVSGNGWYAYWAMENPAATEVHIGPGSVLYNPMGILHQIWNTGTEDLVVLAVGKAIAPMELLGGWPETPEGGMGVVPPAAPWELTCPPGHEPDVEESAPAPSEEAPVAPSEEL